MVCFFSICLDLSFSNKNIICFFVKHLFSNSYFADFILQTLNLYFQMRSTGRHEQDNNLVVTSNLKTSFDSRWSQLKITGKNIKPRSGHISGFFGNIMFVHGGYNSEIGILDDFYSIDLSEDKAEFIWQKEKSQIEGKPIKLKDHSGVVYKGMIVLFGGQTGTNQNTNQVLCYRIGHKEWSKVKTSGLASIPKVDSHCACLMDENMFIYGGYVADQGEYLKDILCLNLNTMEWKKFYASSPNSEEPEARNCGSMIAHSGNLWLFGGSNGTKTLNDMWKFDLAQNKWQKIDCTNRPDPRRGHSMVLYKNNIFLFGGIQDVTREKNDVYVYEFEKNCWNKIHTYTNSIYQCSPTLKKSQNKQTLSKSIDSFSIQRLSPVKSMQSGDDLMKKIMSENRQKKFLQKKKQLMKKFNENYQDYKKKRRVSPTTQSMMKSLQSIGDQEDNKNGYVKEIVYDETGRYIVGKKPCARDGQTVVVCGDKMYICGGDRHLMSFNDIFMFDLEKGLKSLQLYRSK